MFYPLNYGDGLRSGMSVLKVELQSAGMPLHSGMETDTQHIETQLNNKNTAIMMAVGMSAPRKSNQAETPSLK